MLKQFLKFRTLNDRNLLTCANVLGGVAFLQPMVAELPNARRTSDENSRIPINPPFGRRNRSSPLELALKFRPIAPEKSGEGDMLAFYLGEALLHLSGSGNVLLSGLRL